MEKEPTLYYFNSYGKDSQPQSANAIKHFVGGIADPPRPQARCRSTKTWRACRGVALGTHRDGVLGTMGSTSIAIQSGKAASQHALQSNRFRTRPIGRTRRETSTRTLATNTRPGILLLAAIVQATLCHETYTLVTGCARPRITHTWIQKQRRNQGMAHSIAPRRSG